MTAEATGVLISQLPKRDFKSMGVKFEAGSLENNDISKFCNEDELRSSKLPNMVVPARDALKPKRIRSFGDISMANAQEFCFSSSDEEDNTTTYKLKDIVKKQSLVEKVLLTTWDEKSEKGLFKYDVLKCPSKRISGKFEFVAQLNEGRATKKRATEFHMDKVCQSFDGKKFNFQKAKQDEVLFQFEMSSDEYTSCYEDVKKVSKNSSFVYINISPIEYGHVLLVPKVLQCIPQQMNTESLMTALHMSVEVHNPCFKIGFNTLGAYATINHLHFQGYFLNAPFPVERVLTEYLPHFASETGSRMRVSYLVDYPVRAYVFELGSDLEELSQGVANACKTLENMNIPYNLLIVDCGARVFLFPQKFDENKKLNMIPEEVLDTQVNPAAFEIGGHIVLKRKQDYNAITEEKICELLSYASLSQSDFDKLTDVLFD